VPARKDIYEKPLGSFLTQYFVYCVHLKMKILITIRFVLIFPRILLGYLFKKLLQLYILFYFSECCVLNGTLVKKIVSQRISNLI